MQSTLVLAQQSLELTLTIFAFARLILNIPAGLLADRFGRKVLLVGGPAITAIGMFGSGWADSILSLLAWRFVAGAGSAFYMSGALIYLIDIAPPDKRARVHSHQPMGTQRWDRIGSRYRRNSCRTIWSRLTILFSGSYVNS